MLRDSRLELATRDGPGPRNLVVSLVVLLSCASWSQVSGPIFLVLCFEARVPCPAFRSHVAKPMSLVPCARPAPCPWSHVPGPISSLSRCFVSATGFFSLLEDTLDVFPHSRSLVARVDFEHSLGLAVSVAVVRGFQGACASC